MRGSALLLLALALTGCRSAPPPPAPEELSEQERIGVLLVQLQLPDPARVDAARVALVRRGSSVAPRVLQVALSGTPRASANAIEILGALGARDSIVPICSILASRRPEEVRLAAAHALAALASPLAVNGLSRALATEPSAEVRAACIVALRRIDDPRAGAAILTALRDPAEMVRAAAVEAIVAHPPDGAGEAVASAYASLPPSGAWREKERILALLVSWNDPHACDLLLDALANPFSSVTRREAARLLGQSRDPRAVRALVQAIVDARPEVALAAHISLARITHRTVPEAPRTDDALSREALHVDWEKWLEQRR